MTHHMRLVDFAYKVIKNKTKDIEVRLNDEKRQLIKVGDIIEFEQIDTKEIMKVEVINLYHFKTFEELLEYFPNVRLGLDKDATYKTMDNFYPKEEQEKYGTLGIEIKEI